MDVFEEIKDPFGISASACENLYGWVPEKFKKHNFTRLLYRTLRTGEIEKVIKVNEVFLRLTSAGEKKIVRDFPLFSLQKRPWDGKWRAVVFDIAEISRINRDLLRRKLKELGFGMFQKSIWITPYDITTDFEEFIAAEKLSNVYIMEISHILVGEIGDFVKKVWSLGAINEEYQKILEEAEKLKTREVAFNDRGIQCQAKKTKETKRKFEIRIEKVRKELKRRYVELLLKDPCLPPALLPEDWAGEETRKALTSV